MRPTLPPEALDSQTADWRSGRRASVHFAAMNQSELVTTASPLINTLGSAFYFTPATLARGKELGLRGMQYYILGRGGVLGDADSSVIRSAFGYFNATVIRDAWDSGRAIVAPRVAGHEYFQSAAQHGRTTLADTLGMEAFADAAAAINDAADDTGLPLYAGIKSEPLADDTLARAYQLIVVLRELRGSAHLLALRAVGIEDTVAHFIKRPDAVKMFGYTPEDVPEFTEPMHAAMAEAEALTDRLVTPAYAALNEAQQSALVDGLHAIQKAHTPAS